MNAVLAPARRPVASGDSDITHLWCCDPNVSHCGLDITDLPEVDDDDDNECVVCVDLDDEPCPHCGWTPEDLP